MVQHLITAQGISFGKVLESVVKLLPKDSRCFLTIDFDVLDPSIMPAVGAPTPGGLSISGNYRSDPCSRKAQL